jgi:Ca2+-transporting ATPase
VSYRFDRNVYPTKPMKNILKLWLEALGDTMLIILMVLAVVSIILGLAFPETPGERKYGWIEGVAIISAVFIVSSVTAINDYQKEKKFRELSKQSNEIEIKVIRGGKNVNVMIEDVLVGDLVELDSGDQVPADGLVVEAFDLRIDESVMTGEPDAIKKSIEDAPFLLSGCQVAEGCGKMLVTGVGVNSEWGKTLLKLTGDDEDDQTPLEEKLDGLAALIGKAGVGFAVATFLVLAAGWLITKIVNVTKGKDKFAWADISQVVRFAVIAVTIVVVAVPEGLPLAVTISLAYSVKKMMKDNNLVRHLAACETMGGATNICSDKTGTLTLNEMRVVKANIANTKYYDGLPHKSDLNDSVLSLLSESISVNSKANLAPPKVDSNKEYEVQGNKTEAAMLIMLKDMDVDYKQIRDHYELNDKYQVVYTFSSKMKRMGCIIENDDKEYILHCKGASEIVLGLCTRYLNADGTTATLNDNKKKEFSDTIEELAKTGLRTLGIAYRHVDRSNEHEWHERDVMETDLTLISIVGIKDPLRKEVVDAVAQCKRSGIFVRMVTGDNILTAQHIARECGILDDDGIAMEGPDFRKLEDDEIDEILPRLQVLARSSPTDKYKLVKRLKDKGEVVAVTGDGTNDGPALKEADVGLSMGIAGTQIAKEASDIIIMDDNFSSIVKAVLWGRSIFENIRKFLQFQLTVNIVALVVTIVTALTSFILKGNDGNNMEPPLTAVQLLWVNLIMDTFAALALATEPPVPELLNRKPYGRTESLITKKMWVSIIGQAIYQLAVLLGLYYFGETIGIAENKEYNRTVVFNAFVLCQAFNEFNCRKINFELNIFSKLHKSIMFMLIFVVTIVAQALIVTFGGRFTQTVPLHWQQWLLCLGLGVLSIPFGYVIRLTSLAVLKLTGRPLYDDVDDMRASLVHNDL